jgi:ATP-dependent DNA ligase
MVFTSSARWAAAKARRASTYLVPLTFSDADEGVAADVRSIGDDWVHEIKHDGFRFLAWRDGYRVRLFTRRGYDWSDRYPALVRAIGTLREGPAALSESLRAGEDAVTLQGGALPAVPA